MKYFFLQISMQVPHVHIPCANLQSKCKHSKLRYVCQQIIYQPCTSLQSLRLPPEGLHAKHTQSCGHESNNRTTPAADRKSTRLNSSHQIISYAVFCLKKKKIQRTESEEIGRQRVFQAAMVGARL